MKETKGLDALIARLEQETDQVDDTTRFLIKRLWQWGVEQIYDDDIRRSVSNYFQVRVPYQFFISPATTLKVHHVRWHNEPGGVVRHIIESCRLIDIFLNSYGFMDRKRLKEDSHSRLMHDIVIAATLISDTQKRGFPWGSETVRNHGEVAADKWNIVAIGCKVPKATIDKVLEAATYHYARFTPRPAADFVGSIESRDVPYEIWELPLHVQIVHFADSVSSMKTLEDIYNPRRRIPAPSTTAVPEHSSVHGTA